MLFSTAKNKAVKQAKIEFTVSQKTVLWQESDGSLLDFAENLGIPALSSCRSGYCGACCVELLSGEITYLDDIDVELNKGEILLCSAKPLTNHIKIKL